MRLRYRALALAAWAMGALLTAGCGPSTTNEENIGAGTAAPAKAAPAYKSYADFATAQQKEQAAKSQPAGKGKGAPNGEPTPSPEKKSQ